MGEPNPEQAEREIKLISYSVRKGTPKSAEWLNGYGLKRFDVSKVIDNPFRVPSLRVLNGLHPDVQQFIKRCPRTTTLLNEAEYFARHMWGLKAVAFGCYGGKHRSVAMVELLAARLASDPTASHIRVKIEHRDINQEGGEK